MAIDTTIPPNATPQAADQASVTPPPDTATPQTAPAMPVSPAQAPPPPAQGRPNMSSEGQPAQVGYDSSISKGSATSILRGALAGMLHAVTKVTVGTKNPNATAKPTSGQWSSDPDQAALSTLQPNQPARTGGLANVLKTIGQHTRVGQEIQNQMDEHTANRVANVQGAIKAHEMVLANQTSQNALTDQQNQLAAGFSNWAAANGITLRTEHGAGHDNLTPQDAKNAGNGTDIHVSNGKTGDAAGVHIFNAADLDSPIQTPYSFPVTFKVDKDGQVVPDQMRTIPEGTTGREAYYAYLNSQKQMADLQKQEDDRRKSEGEYIKNTGQDTPKDQADRKSREGIAANVQTGEKERAAAVQKGENDRAAAHEAGENARANRRVKAEQAGTANTDVFGNTSTLPEKEFNKRYDAFNNSQVAKTANILQGSYDQFQDIAKQINSGQGINGPESVVALFNAIGISATPLAGKGFRINENTIQEHVGARGLGENVDASLLKLKAGDVITPQQVLDYAKIAEHTYIESYVNAANQQKRQLGYIDILPVGNNRVVDPVTDQIYLRVAGNDRAKADKALQSSGWILPQKNAGAPSKAKAEANANNQNPF